MVLVIFDVDGTLIYSEKRDSLAFAATYEKLYRRPFPTIDWRQFPHVTDDSIFDTVIRRHFNRPSTQEEIAHFQGHYLGLLEENRRSSPGHYQEVPGARQAVAKLTQNEQYVVGVATGGWKESAVLKLQHVGIHVDHRLFSGADGKHQREHILDEVIGAARSLNGNTFTRVVYIGDAIWDVHTTRNMALNFIGVRRSGDYEVLQQAGARHVISDYLDLPHFLSLLEEAVPPEGGG